MALPDLISYFVTLIAIAVAPGPVVLMLLVRAASNDVAGATGFAVGFAVGGVVITAAVSLGLSTWMTSVPEVFVYSKYLMMAYISWVAFGIWKGGFNLSGDCEVKRCSLGASLFAGLITCFISPYMMVLFPLVLPEMINIQVIEMPEFLIIAVMTFLALATGAALIVGFASQLRRIARSPRSAMLLNRGLAIVLLSGGGWMAIT